jgi:transcriptional antiterminator NusG
MLQNYDGRWFAIQVRPNAEHATLAALQSKEYEAYLPTYRCKRQWSDRVRTLNLPLFAGYLFCRFNSAIQTSIISTPGVLRILGLGSTPLPVDDSEIISLRAIVAADNVHFYPWPKLEVGSNVCIRAGPLRGVVGTLRLIKDQQTLIVSVPLLQRSVAVEIQADWIVGAETYHASVDRTASFGNCRNASHRTQNTMSSKNCSDFVTHKRIF